MTIPSPAPPPPLIPPTVPPPPTKSGCWKWGAIGCIAVIILLAIGAGVIAMIVFGTIKSTDVYRGARAAAEKDPRVIEALGSPVHAGFWVWGNAHINDHTGEADLEFPIEGPKGKAYVHAVATRDQRQWRYSKLTVRVRNGPSIDVLKP